MERLKKHGVDSPFVMFMKSEVSKMSECLQVIHDDLKVCALFCYPTHGAAGIK